MVSQPTSGMCEIETANYLMIASSEVVIILKPVDIEQGI